jgi:predicted GIY-YIG superfamily endonuclease
MATPSEDGWHVYILRCADGTFYTGIAKDVDRRCRQHNDGKASRYTRSRRPTRLVYQEPQPDQAAALRREAAIKALSRREKATLIREGRRRVP